MAGIGIGTIIGLAIAWWLKDRGGSAALEAKARDRDYESRYSADG